MVNVVVGRLFKTPLKVLVWLLDVGLEGSTSGGRTKVLGGKRTGRDINTDDGLGSALLDGIVKVYIGMSMSSSYNREMFKGVSGLGDNLAVKLTTLSTFAVLTGSIGSEKSVYTLLISLTSASSIKRTCSLAFILSKLEGIFIGRLMSSMMSGVSVDSAIV